MFSTCRIVVAPVCLSGGSRGWTEKCGAVSEAEWRLPTTYSQTPRQLATGNFFSSTEDTESCFWHHHVFFLTYFHQYLSFTMKLPVPALLSNTWLSVTWAEASVQCSHLLLEVGGVTNNFANMYDPNSPRRPFTGQAMSVFLQEFQYVELSYGLWVLLCKH